MRRRSFLSVLAGIGLTPVVASVPAEATDQGWTLDQFNNDYPAVWYFYRGYRYRFTGLKTDRADVSLAGQWIAFQIDDPTHAFCAPVGVPWAGMSLTDPRTENCAYAYHRGETFPINGRMILDDLFNESGRAQLQRYIEEARVALIRVLDQA